LFGQAEGRDEINRGFFESFPGISAMSPQLLEPELNGNTKEELELIRFEYRDSEGILIDRKVTIPKFRPYGDVRDSAVDASHEIVRHSLVR